jgi:hypothetical protein
VEIPQNRSRLRRIIINEVTPPRRRSWPSKEDRKTINTRLLGSFDTYTLTLSSIEKEGASMRKVMQQLQ